MKARYGRGWVVVCVVVVGGSSKIRKISCCIKVKGTISAVSRGFKNKNISTRNSKAQGGLFLTPENTIRNSELEKCFSFYLLTKRDTIEGLLHNARAPFSSRLSFLQKCCRDGSTVFIPHSLPPFVSHHLLPRTSRKPTCGRRFTRLCVSVQVPCPGPSQQYL